MSNNEVPAPHICPVCRARDYGHVYGCKVQKRWVAIRPGVHRHGPYEIRKRSTPLCPYREYEWVVLYKGRQVGLSPYLDNAKPQASAHEAQLASGII